MNIYINIEKKDANYYNRMSKKVSSEEIDENN